MPEAFFADYPQLKGVPGEGFYTMCTSTPEVQKYLYDSAALIASRAPGLGGFLTITASENFTNCYSHYSEANCPCPRCAKRSRPAVIAEVNNLLYRGAASVNPDFRHIAWSWGWEKGHIPQIIDEMDPGITVMGVSEQAVEKQIGDAVTSVIDYSISVVGPGEYALSTWRHAKAAGHPAFAKIQLNNTWECPSVPFIPAFEQIYRHLCGIADAGVDGIMLGWTLGGYPSPTMFMLNALLDSPQRPTLRQLYERVFPAEAADLVEQACHAFSEAFDHYPFNIGTAYNAPQNVGSANLLYLTCSTFAATMTCYPYDHLDSWRSIFSRETFAAQLDKLAARWEEGLEILSALPDELVKSSAALSDLVDSAQACGYTFASMANQTHFVLERIGNADPDVLADLTRREAELAIRTAIVSARNPLIGYESSNHYFYNRFALAEKVVNCADILSRLGKD